MIRNPDTSVQVTYTIHASDDLYDTFMVSGSSATISDASFTPKYANIRNVIPWIEIMSEKELEIFEDEPEIAPMSIDELRAAVEAAYGAWADREDITDDWLDNLRTGWNYRLEKLYGNQSS
jgi:hypothetical protein